MNTFILSSGAVPVRDTAPAMAPADSCFHHRPLIFSSSVNSSGIARLSPMSSTYSTQHSTSTNIKNGNKINIKCGVLVRLDNNFVICEDIIIFTDILLDLVCVFRPKLIAGIAEVTVFYTRRLRPEHSGFKSNEVTTTLPQLCLTRLINIQQTWPPTSDPHFLHCRFSFFPHFLLLSLQNSVSSFHSRPGDNKAK